MADNSTIIDSIGLEITTDNTKALSGIDKTITALVNLQMIIEGMHNEIKPIVELSEAIHKLSTSKIPATLPSRIAEIANATKGIDTSAVDRISDIAEKMESVGTGIGTGGADTLDASFKEVQTTVDATASTLGEVQAEMANVGLGSSTVAENIKESVAEAKELKQTLAETTADKAVSPIIGQLREVQAQISTGPQSKIMDFVDMDSAMRNFTEFKTVPIQARPDWDLLKESINQVGIKLDVGSQSADDFGRSMRKATASPVIIGGLKKIGGGLKTVLDHTIGAKSGFGRLLHSIKRIATYRAIRAALKAITQGFREGIENLYQWSAAFDSTREFANSMDKIATALQYVKNSLGAMVAPIINYLAPALDFLADKFVMVLNVVNEFFAAMTGASTYTVARKVAKQFKEIESGASGAAKAVRSFTIGIDELNIIEDTGGGGGGAGGAMDVGEDWFEKQTVSNEMKSLADDIKGYFDYVFSEDMWDDFGGLMVQGWNDAKDAAKGYFDYVRSGDAVIDVAVVIGEAGADVIEYILSGELEKDLDDLIPKMDDFINLQFLGDTKDWVWALLPQNIKNVLTPLQDVFNVIADIYYLYKNLKMLLTGKTTSKGATNALAVLGLKNEKSWVSNIVGIFQGFGGAAYDAFVDGFATISGAKATDFAVKVWRFLTTPGEYAIPKYGELGSSGGIKFVQRTIEGMNSKSGQLKSAVQSIAVNASSAAANSTVLAQFKKGGEYMVSGIIQGLDSKKGSLYNSMKKIVDDTYKEFAKRGQIHSPSKLFAEGGKWLVLGLNKGVEDNAQTTVTTIGKWFDKFGGIKPTVDTSGMSIPSIGDMVGSVQGNITTSGRMTFDGATTSLEEFLVDTLMPVVNQISDDAKRQADKSETITIDGRKLTDSVNRQNRTNGYSFT